MKKILLTQIILSIMCLGGDLPNEQLDNPVKPINEYHLKVNIEGRLAWSDSEKIFIIIEANSPENRLRWMDKKELDLLHSYGANTIYCTLFGGDDKSVHPFINRKNPSLGFDEEKINKWKEYLEYWVSLGNGRNVVHLLLSEVENHKELKPVDHEKFISKMVTSFSHLPVIWDREELNTGDTYIQTWYEYLKQKDSKNISAIHNVPNKEPWKKFIGSGLIQLISFQGTLRDAQTKLKPIYDQAIKSNHPWAVYASELNPWDKGIQPSSLDLASRWFEAGGVTSSGVGVYKGKKDQSPPNVVPYESVYKKLSMLASTFTYPNLPELPTNIKNCPWGPNPNFLPVLITEHNSIMEVPIGTFGNTHSYPEARLMCFNGTWYSTTNGWPYFLYKDEIDSIENRLNIWGYIVPKLEIIGNFKKVSDELYGKRWEKID